MSKTSAWQFLSAQNPKQNYLSLQFLAFSRWIASHAQEMDSLCCTDLLHARAQNLHLPGWVQSNSCRNQGIPDVWLSNSVFSEIFKLFESNSRSIGLSAKKSYFGCIFYEGHVILWERNNFRAIFFALSSFVFTLLAYHVVSLTASEELLL